MEQISISLITAVIESLMIIPASAYIFVGVVHKMKANRGIKRRVKPFDCVSCLSFWVYLFVAALVYQDPAMIKFAPTAYIIGAIFDRHV